MQFLRNVRKLPSEYTASHPRRVFSNFILLCPLLFPGGEDKKVHFITTLNWKNPEECTSTYNMWLNTKVILITKLHQVHEYAPSVTRERVLCNKNNAYNCTLKIRVYHLKRNTLYKVTCDINSVLFGICLSRCALLNASRLQYEAMRSHLQSFCATGDSSSLPIRLQWLQYQVESWGEQLLISFVSQNMTIVHAVVSGNSVLYTLYSKEKHVSTSFEKQSSV